MSNFGDFQNEVYAAAVQGVTTRYPFDFASIERKAAEALPDWVYRYVSAAEVTDGPSARTSPHSRAMAVVTTDDGQPARTRSVDPAVWQNLVSPMFLAPIGLVGLCSPDFHGDVAAAQASAATGVPYTLSTFTQTRMEDVVPHAKQKRPSFHQLYLPSDRELAASLINRAETSGYSALMVTVDSWTLGFRPMDLERGNFPQFRGFCMQNYYTDVNFTKHLPSRRKKTSRPPWRTLEDLRPSTVVGGPALESGPRRSFPLAIKGIQHPDDARLGDRQRRRRALLHQPRWPSGRIRRYRRCSCCRESSRRPAPLRSCSTPGCARRPMRSSRWRWARRPSG